MNVFDVLRGKLSPANLDLDGRCPELSCWEHSSKDCDKCDLVEIKIRDAIEIVNQVEQEYKPKTNADCIRAMSDEELTKIIMCPYDTAGASIDIMPCVTELGTQELVSPEFCNQCMMKWLQREVEE